MNFKDFLSWRAHCFFCNEELMMFPQIVGARANFGMEDGYFIIVSRYITFGFHMETGQLASAVRDVDLDVFLNQSDLEVQVKCPQCETDGKHYCYTGRFRADPVDKNHVGLFFLAEKLAYEGMILEQFPRAGKASIEIYRELEVVDGGDFPPIRRIKLNIPYIDLKQTNPDKLKNKIKTCITFS